VSQNSQFGALPDPRESGNLQARSVDFDGESQSMTAMVTWAHDRTQP